MDGVETTLIKNKKNEITVARKTWKRSKKEGSGTDGSVEGDNREMGDEKETEPNTGMPNESRKRSAVEMVVEDELAAAAKQPSKAP